jgi:shikimate kinase
MTDDVAIADGLAGLAQSVVLVGLMGVGKTAVGKRLAVHVGLPFADADHEIEAAAGMTVAEIFQTCGEAGFRSGERRVIARLIDGPPMVLSTGGGAFVDPQTRSLVKERAISVWLVADIDELVRRTQRRNNRPLLATGDPREILTRLAEARAPCYAQADIHVASSRGPVEETVQRVLLALTLHLDQQRHARP